MTVSEPTEPVRSGSPFNGGPLPPKRATRYRSSRNGASHVIRHGDNLHALLRKIKPDIVIDPPVCENEGHERSRRQSGDMPGPVSGGIVMNPNRSRRSFLASLGGGAVATAAPAAIGRQSLPGASCSIAYTGDRYVHPRKVLLWECTRKEIRDAMESGRLKAAIVPTGSTEQHNEHLAMIHDTASALLVAQNAALRLYPEVIVATPVPVGISPYWMERKGTLTLRPETFLAVVYDICDSLKTHGLKTVLILNGHGGNAAPLKSQLPEWRAKLGIQLEACSYWEAYTEANAARYMESGMAGIPGHSAEFETSVALAAFPDRVHREGVDYSKVRLNLKSAKDAGEDGKYYEESLLATAEKGEALIRIAVDWTAGKMRQMIGQS